LEAFTDRFGGSEKEWRTFVPVTALNSATGDSMLVRRWVEEEMARSREVLAGSRGSS